MLHVTLTIKHGRRDENLNELWEREQQRVVARLAGEPLAQVGLHGEVDLSPHRKEGFASLTLDLPGGALHAQGRGRNHLVALRHATDALLSEIDRQRRQRRDLERDGGTIRPVNGHVGATSAEPFDGPPALGFDGRLPADDVERVAASMPELRAFVAREVECHRSELAGADRRVEVHGVDGIDEIVEEALARALEHREACPPDVPFDRYVFSCAYDVIRVAIERRTSASISLESEVDGDDDREERLETVTDAPVSRWLSDAVADVRSRRADVELAGRDLRLAVMQAIRHLPADERKALSLVALDGLAPGEAARRLGLPEARLEQLMEHARDDVRRELLSHGF